MSARAKAPPAARDGENEYLAAYDAGAFERPSVAVDVALLGVARDELVVLLVRRAEHPFRGVAALPGGFLRPDESLDAAAARVLVAKAGLRDVFLEQLYTFGDPRRDPRTRVVSVAYYALVDADRFERSVAAHDAIVGRLELPQDGTLAITSPDGAPIAPAFDHAGIVETAVRRIRGKLDYTPIGYELLPASFTLSQLQRVHEIVAGRALNKDSFRRRILASGLVVPTSVTQSDVGHRPAALYAYRNGAEASA